MRRNRGVPYAAKLRGGDMDASGFITGWQRFDRIEQSLCLRVNRGCHYPLVKLVFTVVSRLGDGGFWYLLMLMLAMNGAGTAMVAVQMAVTGAVGTALYKLLKRRFVRERPYIAYPAIELGSAPLDRYSFPSGHTLHAVCFTILATAHVPELVPILLPFTMLVGASRVVLGLHYPTDVMAGGLIGALLASASLSVWPA
jgi:undecaprenyl-diphosphatase